MSRPSQNPKTPISKHPHSVLPQLFQRPPWKKKKGRLTLFCALNFGHIILLFVVQSAMNENTPKHTFWWHPVVTPNEACETCCRLQSCWDSYEIFISHNGRKRFLQFREMLKILRLSNFFKIKTEYLVWKCFSLWPKQGKISDVIKMSLQTVKGIVHHFGKCIFFHVGSYKINAAHVFKINKLQPWYHKPSLA